MQTSKQMKHEASTACLYRQIEKREEGIHFQLMLLLARNTSLAAEQGKGKASFCSTLLDYIQLLRSDESA